MKKKLLVFVLVMALALSLAGCGKDSGGAEAPAAVPQEPAQVQTPAEEAVRQDGERFEGTIMLEGMEETVRYEHIRNEALGFEMDYDYESFARCVKTCRECFVPVYDDPDDPLNCLEVSYSAEAADAAAAAAGAKLSGEYDIITSPFVLDRAGSCIKIDASKARGGGTPDLLQTVYVIPAADGCRIATVRYSFESAEGFGKRISAMVNTLAPIEASGERLLTDDLAMAAVQKYCYASNPELEELVRSGDYPIYWAVTSGDEAQVVVLFRSYTGAQVRFYIDRVTGEARVTESVPETASEEERTDISLNLWDYAD